MKTNEITQLNEEFANATPEALLGYFLDRYGSRIALSSSLSIEDQVLTDMICRLKPDARIFTLDTGRLFPETYNLIDQTAMHYGIRLEVFFPDCTEVEKLVADCGINGFYEVWKSANGAVGYANSTRLNGRSGDWTPGYAVFGANSRLHAAKCGRSNGMKHMVC